MITSLLPKINLTKIFFSCLLLLIPAYSLYAEDPLNKLKNLNSLDDILSYDRFIRYKVPYTYKRLHVYPSEKDHYTQSTISSSGVFSTPDNNDGYEQLLHLKLIARKVEQLLTSDEKKVDLAAVQKHKLGLRTLVAQLFWVALYGKKIKVHNTLETIMKKLKELNDNDKNQTGLEYVLFIEKNQNETPFLHILLKQRKQYLELTSVIKGPQNEVKIDKRAINLWNELETIITKEIANKMVIDKKGLLLATYTTPELFNYFLEKGNQNNQGDAYWLNGEMKGKTFLYSFLSEYYTDDSVLRNTEGNKIKEAIFKLIKPNKKDGIDILATNKQSAQQTYAPTAFVEACLHSESDALELLKKLDNNKQTTVYLNTIIQNPGDDNSYDIHHNYDYPPHFIKNESALMAALTIGDIGNKKRIKMKLIKKLLTFDGIAVTEKHLDYVSATYYSGYEKNQILNALANKSNIKGYSYLARKKNRNKKIAEERQQAIKNLTEKNGNNQNIINNLTTENNQQKNEYTKQKNLFKKLKDEYDLMEKKGKEEESKLQKIKTYNENNQNRNRDVEIKEWKNKTNKQDIEIEKLNNDNTLLYTQITELKKNIDDEKNEHRKTIESLKLRKKEKETKFNQQENQLNNEKLAKKNELTKLQSDNSKKIDELNDEHTKKIEQLKKENKILLDKEKEKYHKEQESIAKKVGADPKLQNELTNAQESYDKLQTEYNTLQEDSKKKVENIEKEKEKLENELKNINESKAELRQKESKKLEKMKKSQEKMKMMLDEATQNNTSIANQIQQAKENRSSLEKNKQQLDDDITQEEKKIKKEQLQVDSIQNDMTKLQESLAPEYDNPAIKSLKEEIKKEVSDEKDLQQKMDQLIEDNLEGEEGQYLTKLKNKVTARENQKKKLKQKLTKLEKKQEKEVSEWSKKLRDKKFEYEILEEKHNASKNKVNKAKENDVTRTQDDKKRVNQLKEDLKLSEKKATELKEAIATHGATIDTLKKEKTKLTALSSNFISGQSVGWILSLVLLGFASLQAWYATKIRKKLADAIDL